MDEQQKALCKQLIKMSSEQAVDWLMSKYPIDSTGWGEAILLISHRSWSRSDQRRLAQYYFKKLPFSSYRGYEAFASIMSVSLMLSCIKENLPVDSSRLELLLYYLMPVLSRAAKNEGDLVAIQNFALQVQ